MDFKKHFLKIDGSNLRNNVYTEDRLRKAEDFLKTYSFVKKDNDYTKFLLEINGVELFTNTHICILYGFAFSEPEMIFSINQYLDDLGYLLIGEYTDKRKKSSWRTIGYYYYKFDQSPVIYAKFFYMEDQNTKGKLYPLCIGFNELVEIISNNDYDEQFNMAYTPDFPA